MLLFTVGPVQMDRQIQLPYARTIEFSKMMKENEELILSFSHAPAGSEVYFLTGSGTSAMEASVVNGLTPQDRVLIIHGGTFSKRWIEICQTYQIPYDTIDLALGENITDQHFAGRHGYNAVLVNLHETSTGVLYDHEVLKRYCAKERCLLIVDAISTLFADPFDMANMQADLVICASQKALALAPGISFVIASQRMQQRFQQATIPSYYLNLTKAKQMMENGQTPFTPNMEILQQMHQRLSQIQQQSLAKYIDQIHQIAVDFRQKIQDLPFDIPSQSLSNAITPLIPKTGNAYHIFERLYEQYEICICSNRGKYRDQLIRVGHMGNLTFSDNDRLIAALKEIMEEMVKP